MPVSTRAVLDPVSDGRQLVPPTAPRHLAVVDPMPHQPVSVGLDPGIGAGTKDHRAQPGHAGNVDDLLRVAGRRVRPGLPGQGHPPPPPETREGYNLADRCSSGDAVAPGWVGEVVSGCRKASGTPGWSRRVWGCSSGSTATGL